MKVESLLELRDRIVGIEDNDVVNIYVRDYVSKVTKTNVTFELSGLTIRPGVVLVRAEAGDNQISLLLSSSPQTAWEPIPTVGLDGMFKVENFRPFVFGGDSSLIYVKIPNEVAFKSWKFSQEEVRDLSDASQEECEDFWRKNSFGEVVSGANLIVAARSNDEKKYINRLKNAFYEKRDVE